jgi:hypothetical protein
MLSQFEIGHIKAAFDLAGECQLSDLARAKIAYCLRLIEHAENQTRIAMAANYARANGVEAPRSAEAAAKYINSIADACERLGTTE